jgi:hypothetical protein
VRAADLAEGDVVEPRPGALDDGEPGLEDDVAVGGGDWLRSLRSGTRSMRRDIALSEGDVRTKARCRGSVGRCGAR